MHRVTPHYFVVIFCIEYIHPLSPECATVFANLCNSITRQPIELESSSNPLRIQQVFWLSSKKKIFVLDLGFSWGKVESGGYLCVFFSCLYLALVANPLRHFLVQVVLETRPKSASLETFNGFLAFLEPKLWIKNKNSGKFGVDNIHFLNGHYSPADWARELSKPALNGESLVV